MTNLPWLLISHQSPSNPRKIQRMRRTSRSQASQRNSEQGRSQAILQDTKDLFFISYESVLLQISDLKTLRTCTPFMWIYIFSSVSWLLFLLRWLYFVGCAPLDKPGHFQACVCSACLDELQYLLPTLFLNDISGWQSFTWHELFHESTFCEGPEVSCSPAQYLIIIIWLHNHGKF